MITFACFAMGVLAVILVPVAGALMEESDRRTRLLRESRPGFDEWVCSSLSVALYIAAGALGFVAFGTTVAVNIAKDNL